MFVDTLVTLELQSDPRYRPQFGTKDYEREFRAYSPNPTIEMTGPHFSIFWRGKRGAIVAYRYSGANWKGLSPTEDIAMMKQQHWGDIKRAAGTEQTGEICSLDRLVTDYHSRAKSDISARVAIVDAIINIAGPIQQRAVKVDGTYVAICLLLGSALDTRKRLELDVQSGQVMARTGREAKPLDSMHRHEILDPQHRRWGVGLVRENLQYEMLRTKWKNLQLQMASSGQAAVASFYSFLATVPGVDSPYCKSRYLTTDEQVKKMLVFLAPGQPGNATKEVLICRRKATPGGELKVYDSKWEERIFVMLEGNEFYACKAGSDETQIHPNGAMHHSGLAGGRPVLGAGGMVVSNGRLVALNQQSGHYRPNPEQVLNVLEALEHIGIDLNTVTLKAYTYFNDPLYQQPDDPDPTSVNPFPPAQPVPARYYLETKGTWAYVPERYRQNPMAPKAAPLELLANAFREKVVWQAPVQDQGRVKVVAQQNGAQPALYANAPGNSPRPHVPAQGQGWVRGVVQQQVPQPTLYANAPSNSPRPHVPAQGQGWVRGVVPRSGALPPNNPYVAPHDLKMLPQNPYVSARGLPPQPPLAPNVPGGPPFPPASNVYGVIAPVSQRANGSFAAMSPYGTRIPARQLEDDGREWA